MEENYSYANSTYNSQNRLARFSHRYRFNIGVDLVLEKPFTTILDYGAGDNKFLDELYKEKNDIELSAFEPVMSISTAGKTQVFTKLSELKNKKFDVITCFEVLEHFNELNQNQILKRINELLQEGGRAIISVPVEIGFVSIVKNIKRMNFRKVSLKEINNILKCFVGKQIPEIRQNDGYIFSHVGFNHKLLEKIILKKFKIIKKETSPLKILPSTFNSQIFYVLEKL